MELLYHFRSSADTQQVRKTLLDRMLRVRHQNLITSSVHHNIYLDKVTSISDQQFFRFCAEKKMWTWTKQQYLLQSVHLACR